MGCIFALALVFLPGVLASVLLQPTGGAEWTFMLVHGVLLAIPFGYVALEGTKAWLPWVVAAVLSACFWGALIADVIISARNRSGADMGMGLIMMLVSPFVTTTGAWMAVQYTNRLRK